MKNKYTSLRTLVCKQKNNPILSRLIARSIFRWARDEKMELWEFAFLTKKALNYISKNT